MAARSGPIYEVTLFVDREFVAACDEWLAQHAAATPGASGVGDCRVFSIADDAAGRAGRVCQLEFDTAAALDDYLQGTGADVEADIVRQLGKHVAVQARVLREDPAEYLPPDDSPDCLNCGTRLRGQYCGNCGQRSRSRLISLWELIRDAFGDLFELDSRLWQTVVPLLTRPGRLTHDYLQGRRARFMPPFRMYLVMSLAFFVVAFFDPREELSLFFEPPPADVVAPGSEAKKNATIVIGIDENGDKVEEDCDIDADGLDELPEFLARRLTVERIQHICRQIVADEGKSLTAKVIDSTPAALIILLPLMALVLKVLYPLSRRYYVEHLLFFVHFHAFVFLLLTIEILLTRFAALLGMPQLVSTLAIVAMSIYIPTYVFVAMRRVYGQGRIVTFLKFVVLALAYITGFSIIITATFLTAAFSI